MIPFLLGTKTKVRPKKDGQRVERFCPECETNAVFAEADVAHALTILGKEVFSMGDEEAYLCTACDECMYLSATQPPKPGAKAADGTPQTLVERMAARREARLKRKEELAKAEQLAAQFEAEAAAQVKAEQDKQDAIDDELAALKKKLGL